MTKKLPISYLRTQKEKKQTKKKKPRKKKENKKQPRHQQKKKKKKKKNQENLLSRKLGHRNFYKKSFSRQKKAYPISNENPGKSYDLLGRGKPS